MNSKPKEVLVFFVGAMIGLLASAVFGYFTSPVDSTFEGSGGYHLQGMLILYPVASLVFGIISIAAFKLMTRSRRSATDK